MFARIIYNEISTVGPYVLVLLVTVVSLCALRYVPSERGAAGAQD